MKRDPNGAEREYSLQDLAALLRVNLGRIDLNKWYAACDDADQPDHLHFDLDPGPGAAFDLVLGTTLAVRYSKTNRSRGIYQYTWASTLAPLYSARPKPGAHVSTPVRLNENEHGITTENFRISNVPIACGEAAIPSVCFCCRGGACN